MPKFEVGEVVILRCADYPHVNGEYTVSLVVMPHEEYADPVFGQPLKLDSEIGYYLDGMPLVLQDGSGKDASPCWYERALFKKHRPGEMSFRDLMQTLKDPSKCLNA